MVGLVVGNAVGYSVGVSVGKAGGYPVGLSVGAAVGAAVGKAVGLCVGAAVGYAVGYAVGACVAHCRSVHGVGGTPSNIGSTQTVLSLHNKSLVAVHALVMCLPAGQQLLVVRQTRSRVSLPGAYSYSFGRLAGQVQHQFVGTEAESHTEKGWHLGPVASSP